MWPYVSIVFHGMKRKAISSREHIARFGVTLGFYRTMLQSAVIGLLY